MANIEVGGVLCEVRTCCSCGVVVVIPEGLVRHKRENGGSYYCVNGHSQGWTREQGEIEKIRRERDRLKQNEARLEDLNRALAASAAAETERASKAEATATRIKKRAAAGTCPCCKRTFGDMSSHMKKQHPEFIQETRAKVVRLKPPAQQTGE